MSSSSDGSRTIRAEEPADVPADGLFFGTIAMLPLAAAALGLYVLPDDWAFLLVNLSLLWGAAIVTFLSGVRRGVSFRQPGGPKISQFAMMLFLFLAGFVGIVAVVWAYPLVSCASSLAGYVALAAIDPISAKRGTAPLYFAKLRPFQMLIPIVSLAVIGYWISTSPFF